VDGGSRLGKHNSIIATVARKEQVSMVHPERYTVIQRAAENLSRRNVDQAVVELFSEAMQRLTILAYEQDDHGYCNIDPVTRRLLIPSPWGRNGHAKWGITSTESIVLREMIQQRQKQTDSRPPGLWLYDRERRAWRLNLFDYDTLADGQRYWQRSPLSVTEYREARSQRAA
jgi:hypothetical protein